MFSRKPAVQKAVGREEIDGVLGRNDKIKVWDNGLVHGIQETVDGGTHDGWYYGTNNNLLKGLNDGTDTKEGVEDRTNKTKPMALTKKLLV